METPVLKRLCYLEWVQCNIVSSEYSIASGIISYNFNQKLYQDTRIFKIGAKNIFLLCKAKEDRTKSISYDTNI